MTVPMVVVVHGRRGLRYGVRAPACQRTVRTGGSPSGRKWWRLECTRCHQRTPKMSRKAARAAAEVAVQCQVSRPRSIRPWVAAPRFELEAQEHRPGCTEYVLSLAGHSWQAHLTVGRDRAQFATEREAVMFARGVAMAQDWYEPDTLRNRQGREPLCLEPWPQVAPAAPLPDNVLQFPCEVDR